MVEEIRNRSNFQAKRIRTHSDYCLTISGPSRMCVLHVGLMGTVDEVDPKHLNHPLYSFKYWTVKVNDPFDVLVDHLGLAVPYDPTRVCTSF